VKVKLITAGISGEDGKFAAETRRA